MSDDDFADLSYGIDKFLIKMADKYDMNALSVSAITLARLVVLCETVGCGDEFRRLCMSASKITEAKHVGFH